MNNLDTFNISAMEKFINDIYQIVLAGGMRSDDNYAIYSELCRYNLKEPNVGKDRGRVGCTEFFPEWQDRYKKSKTMHATKFDRSPFIWFISNPELDTFDKNFIKFYIPVDKEHLLEAGKRIMDFMDSLRIPHQSKISDFIRTDDIVLRISRDNEQYIDKIISFVTNDSYIKEGLMNTNPFVPTIQGIGCMYDFGESYNDDISKAIRDCVYFSEKGHKVKITIQDFIPYYRNYVKHSELRQKLSNDAQKYYLNQFEGQYPKNEILIECFKNTFQKYGIDQLEGALELIIDEGKFKCISNGYSKLDFRKMLEEQVGREYIKKHVDLTLKAFGYENVENMTTEEKVRLYCAKLFSNNLMMNMDNICNPTLKKYGSGQLIEAIKRFIRIGESIGFARFASDDVAKNMNCRLEIKKYDGSVLEEVIRNFAKFNGLDDRTMSLDECIEAYVNRLQENNKVKGI